MNPEELASLTLEHLRHIRARVDQTAADVDIIKHRLACIPTWRSSTFASTKWIPGWITSSAGLN